jgi:hypothetical protein
MPIGRLTPLEVRLRSPLVVNLGQYQTIQRRIYPLEQNFNGAQKQETYITILATLNSPTSSFPDLVNIYKLIVLDIRHIIESYQISSDDDIVNEGDIPAVPTLAPASSFP